MDYTLIYRYLHVRVITQLLVNLSPLMVSALCWPVGWPTECCTKKILFLQNNVVGYTTFVAVVDMPARLMNVFYVYTSLSGFLIIHPDLVWMTLLSCDGVLLLLRMFYFLLPLPVVCHCSVLFHFHCLSFLNDLCWIIVLCTITVRAVGICIDICPWVVINLD